jgi:hypothetical protein
MSLSKELLAAVASFHTAYVLQKYMYHTLHRSSDEVISLYTYVIIYYLLNRIPIIPNTTVTILRHTIGARAVQYHQSL